jgi:hypothetical protein
MVPGKVPTYLRIRKRARLLTWRLRCTYLAFIVAFDLLNQIAKSDSYLLPDMKYVIGSLCKFNPFPA